MTLATRLLHPPAWAVLQQAVANQQAVRLRYHGHDRIVCPHVLGWSHGRLVALVYQSAGTTSTGSLPANPHHRWRSMSIDSIHDAELVPEAPWQTAGNYTTRPVPMDSILIAIPDLK